MEIWRRTFDEVGGEYPDVERDQAYIDAGCVWVV
jgi:isocitrate/isopropylmalate dehydrogenase